MKRISSIIGFVIILTLLLSTAVYADGDTEAKYLARCGILKGSNGDLLLDQYLVLEQLMVILSRLEGEEILILTTNMSTTFTDVPETAWSYKYIAWAQESRILKGNPDGTVGRTGKVTTQRLAAFLLRILGFYDVKWEDVMKVAKEKKLLEGTNVSDTQNLKRSDAAIILFNTLYTECSDGKILITKLPYGPKGSPVESIAEKGSNWIEEEENDEYYLANPLGSGDIIHGDIYFVLDIDIYSFTITESGTVEVTFDLEDDPYGHCEYVFVAIEDAQYNILATTEYTVTYDKKGVQYLKTELEPGDYYITCFPAADPDTIKDVYWDSDFYSIRYTID